jgi:hypothetical protein
MIGMLAFGGLIVAALMVAAVFGVVALLIKGVVLLVLLPLRIAASLILLPFRLLGFLLALFLVPVLAIAALLVTVLGGVVFLALPLLPLAAIALVVWFISKARTHPAAA